MVYWPKLAVNRQIDRYTSGQVSCEEHRLKDSILASTWAVPEHYDCYSIISLLPARTPPMGWGWLFTALWCGISHLGLGTGIQYLSGNSWKSISIWRILLARLPQRNNFKPKYRFNFSRNKNFIQYPTSKPGSQSTTFFQLQKKGNGMLSLEIRFSPSILSPVAAMVWWNGPFEKSKLLEVTRVPELNRHFNPHVNQRSGCGYNKVATLN